MNGQTNAFTSGRSAGLLWRALRDMELSNVAPSTDEPSRPCSTALRGPPDGGEDPIDGTNYAAATIICVSSPGDFDAARSILARYRGWLESLLGGDLAAFQPSALRELAELERFYEPPNGRLLVTMVDGEPAGVVGVHRLGPGVGELKRLYVAPEARGLGIGRALAVAAIEAAYEIGFDLLRLETHAGHMPAAVALYRELGFREADPYNSVVGVDGLLTMELRLPLRRLSA